VTFLINHIIILILFSSGLLDNRNVFLTSCYSANCFNLYLLSTDPLSDTRKDKFDMKRLPVFLQNLLAELEEGKHPPEMRVAQDKQVVSASTADFLLEESSGQQASSLDWVCTHAGSLN